MDASWLSQIEFRHRWAFGIVLAALEIPLPGTILIWMGASGAVTGADKLVLPGLGWECQLLIFAVLSVVSVLFSLMFLRRHPIESDEPDLNQRGRQVVGRVLTLDDPIVNGTGHVRDTIWRVEGEDYLRGTEVKVVDIRGTTLVVEKT
jgi:membrane protein implicated in regulation of membrane protease activity